MSKYTFAREHMVGVMTHIDSFDRTIVNMTPIDNQYEMELDGPISEEQFEHLRDEYGLQEVTH